MLPKLYKFDDNFDIKLMIYDISFLNYLTLHFTDRIKVIDRHRVLIEALYTRVNELYLLIIPLVINELRFSYFDDYYWSRRYQILTYFFSPQLQTIFFSFFFFRTSNEKFLFFQQEYKTRRNDLAFHHEFR